MRDQAAAWHVRSVVLRLDSWNLYGARGLWSEKARGGGGRRGGARLHPNGGGQWLSVVSPSGPWNQLAEAPG